MMGAATTALAERYTNRLRRRPGRTLPEKASDDDLVQRIGRRRRGDPGRRLRPVPGHRGHVDGRASSSSSSTRTRGRSPRRSRPGRPTVRTPASSVAGSTSWCGTTWSTRRSRRPSRPRRTAEYGTTCPNLGWSRGGCSSSRARRISPRRPVPLLPGQSRGRRRGLRHRRDLGRPDPSTTTSCTRPTTRRSAGAPRPIGPDAPSYPDGCLLSPWRLPWREINCLMSNRAERFEVVYQQEDSDPASCAGPKAIGSTGATATPVAWMRTGTAGDSPGARMGCPP